jgi:hypothetical protein
VATSLVTFAFSPDRYVAPVRLSLGAGELAYHLARVATGERARFEWPWDEARGDRADSAPREPLAWLIEHTNSSRLALTVEPSLAQCVCWEGSLLVARYLFDHEYAASHPEAVDDTHLALAHGTIAAKLFDDGAIVQSDEGLLASLRWRGRGAKSAHLGARGSKRGPDER